MSRHDKLLAKILEGKADASIRFGDLRPFLAKPYQVRQVRTAIIKHGLGGKP